MKKTAFALFLASLLFLWGCTWQTPSDEGQYNTQTGTGSPLEQKGFDNRENKIPTVTITADGFFPETLTVNSGETVRFVNNDTSPHWPASDDHPTHKLYPGSDIAKCGTPEQSGIFDACKWLTQNETFSFTFNQTGTWRYHDHLNDEMLGSIVVRTSTGNQTESTGSANTGTIMYFPGEAKYRWFVAKPTQQGKHPALILIHEWWGLNDNIKQLAQEFAKNGYIAFAVDLYGTGATTDQQTAMKMASQVTKNETLAFKNLGYAVEYLKSNPDVDPDKIGTVGWCFWGGWAYQMAKNNLGTKASVMYYGQFNPKDDLKTMRAQILGHFGEKDTSISVDTVKEFQAKLQTLSGSNAVYIYPNVGHGFANQNDPTYNQAAADLAWQRTLDFLNKNVKESKK